MMEFGIALATEVDSWRWVKRAEELGFTSAWFYDTQLLNPDIFACMALAADRTSRIRLGTGVLVPSNRIEPVAANGLATLNRLAPGRIDFGIGTGFTARRTMGLGAVPLGRMQRYIERVQGLLAGERIEWDFEGETRTIGFLDPQLELVNTTDAVPLWVSAFGPKGRALAAALGAGWLNFGAMGGAIEALAAMQTSWAQADRAAGELDSALFFLGAVLTGDAARDRERLMTQAAPMTAVIFHNLADQWAATGELPTGPIAEPFARYLETYRAYEPANARYLDNHKGHLMYVRPDETHLTPELVRATTMSGAPDELIANLRRLRDAGYRQVAVQLVHGFEAAIEDWARVFETV
jgi:5,10-methylenetetrahydromethanopterin reductase